MVSNLFSASMWNHVQKNMEQSGFNPIHECVSLFHGDCRKPDPEDTIEQMTLVGWQNGFEIDMYLVWSDMEMTADDAAQAVYEARFGKDALAINPETLDSIPEEAAQQAQEQGNFEADYVEFIPINELSLSLIGRKTSSPEEDESQGLSP